MTQLPSASKLAWMCRRGLLELDLILKTIREEQYPLLSDEEKALFCDFLDTPDNELLAYLLGQEQIDATEYPDLSSLIAKLSIKKIPSLARPDTSANQADTLACRKN